MNPFDVVVSAVTSPYLPAPLLRGIIRATVGLLRRRLAKEDMRQAARQPAAPAPAGPLYLVDGYHGGIVFWDWLVLPHGGLWYLYNWPLCILPALERAQADRRFKVVLDFDAYTFEEMAYRAPKATALMRRLVETGQLEVVNGTYAQPFARSTSGESFLRQLHYGLTAIREALGTEVKIFYSQEPAYFPQLPQLLSHQGFEGVVLRTQWAAFGTDPAEAATVVRWQGPDGSTLPTVPRYPFQQYERQRATHRGLANMSLAAGDRPDWEPDSLAPFARAAQEWGIDAPLVTDLKDVNMPDAPWGRAVEAAGMANVHFVTASEYLSQVGDEGPAVSYSLDDLPSTLPWGLQGEMLVKARAEAEGTLLLAERLEAIAYAMGHGESGTALDAAWKNLCMAQHHDLHVCGPWHSRRHDRCMAAVGCEYARDARQAAEAVSDSALSFLAERVPGDVLAFNPSPWPRRAYLELTVPASQDTEPIALLDEGRALPCQRVHQTGEAWTLGFVADLPALGYKTFRLGIPGPGAGDERPRPPFSAQFHEDGSLSMAAAGQTLMTVGNFFTVWRDGQWHDSRSGVQRVTQVVEGPVFNRYQLEGEVAGVPFCQHTTLYRDLARVDGQVTFDFGAGVYLGPQMADDRPDRAMAVQDDKKLAVALISPLQTAYCDSPFLVSETHGENLVGLHWAGLEGDGLGVALLNRGTRGYHLDRERGMLRNVLGWGPEEWTYASDNSISRGRSRYTTLQGCHTYEYAFYPYRSRLEAQRAALDYNLPCQSLLATGQAGAMLPPAISFLTVEPDEALVTALLLQEGQVHARLWNCSDHEITARLRPSLGQEALPGGAFRLGPWQVRTV